MPDLMMALDLSQPVGQRLAPEVIAEIEAVAPSTVGPGDITEPKMADGSVSERTIVPGAVTSAAIGAGEVKTVNVGDGAITGPKLADGTVGPTKVDDGVPTVFDKDGNPITVRLVRLTAADFALITTPDPNTWYFIT